MVTPAPYHVTSRGDTRSDWPCSGTALARMPRAGPREPRDARPAALAGLQADPVGSARVDIGRARTLGSDKVRPVRGRREPDAGVSARVADGARRHLVPAAVQHPEGDHAILRIVEERLVPPPAAERGAEPIVVLHVVP